ncbi:hypothetical protein NDU88_007776 [Pleurodeles waltl]|uniref:Uncharacterized protein n=1 Tax=Pleurodeles waltl TaxID=8319 RepID=A0AAV7QNZ9_PLEWA|nr:hypothetical protein NDU88_007776 [Pleurodeles waltl]
MLSPEALGALAAWGLRLVREGRLLPVGRLTAGASDARGYVLLQCRAHAPPRRTAAALGRPLGGRCCSPTVREGCPWDPPTSLQTLKFHRLRLVSGEVSPTARISVGLRRRPRAALEGCSILTGCGRCTCCSPKSNCSFLPSEDSAAPLAARASCWVLVSIWLLAEHPVKLLRGAAAL